MNYSELLQLAKGWGNFISDRIIIWRLLSIDMTIKKYILTSSREFGTPFVGWMTCITYVEYAHAGFTVVVVTPFVEDGVGAHNCGGL